MNEQLGTVETLTIDNFKISEVIEELAFCRDKDIATFVYCGTNVSFKEKNSKC